MSYLEQGERETIVASADKLLELAMPAVTDMVDHLREVMGLGPEATAITIALAYETTVASLAPRALEQLDLLTETLRPRIRELVDEALARTGTIN